MGGRYRSSEDEALLMADRERVCTDKPAGPMAALAGTGALHPPPLDAQAHRRPPTGV